jgi:hypothetical protein
VPAHLTAAPHAAFRDAFMTLTRLLPGYFETRKGFEPLRTDAVASAAEWAIAAHVARDERDESGRPIGSLDGFSFVHVMVFLPLIDNERNAVADAARRLGTLRAGLRLGYGRRRHASITYVPCTRDHDVRSWHVGTDADPYRALTPASDDGAALARLLESAWLERLTKDIWHG